MNESPLNAARREVREELGFEFAGGRLLVVDWVAPHGPWDDSLMFVFDGGALTDKQQARITLIGGELNEYRFCQPEAARRLLRPYVWRRVESALAARAEDTPRYLQNGALPLG
jgi:8-oxo-dGTP diphosphatase